MADMSDITLMLNTAYQLAPYLEAAQQGLEALELAFASNPYTIIILAAEWILKLAGIDPLGWIMSQFTGRPRDAATQQTAQTLVNSRNPATRLYGAVLLRLLNDYNIVISSSSAQGQHWLGLAGQQFIHNVRAQGVCFTPALNAQTWAMSRAAQSGSGQPYEMQFPPDPNLRVFGNAGVLGAYQLGILDAQNKGMTGSAMAANAEQYCLQNCSIPDLLTMQFVLSYQPWQQIDMSQQRWSFPGAVAMPFVWANNTTPAGYTWDPCGNTWNPPASQITCAPGYAYDSGSQTCTLAPAAPPPSPPPQPPAQSPPPVGSPGPGQLSPQPVPPPPSTPQCPPGSHWNAAREACVKDGPHHCDVDQHWDPTTETCILMFPSPQCPLGYVWDATSKSCQPTIPTSPGPPPPPPTGPGGVLEIPPGWQANPYFNNQSTPQPIGQSCPPGYTFNPQTETCDPIWPNQQYCNDWTQPPQCPTPTTDPNVADDSTLEAAAMITQFLSGIQGALAQLAFTNFAQAASEASCCPQVIQALNRIASVLAALPGAVSVANSGAPTTPTDLSGVIAALEGVQNAIAGLSPTAPDLSSLVDALNGITAQLAAGTILNLTDLKAIADAQTTLANHDDVPQAIIDQLMNDGYLPKSYSGLLQGAPPHTVDPVTDSHANDSLIRKLALDLKKFIKNDPTVFAGVTGRAVGDSLDDAGVTPTEVSNDLAYVTTGVFKALFEAGKTIFGPITDSMLKVHQDEISKLGQVRPGDEQATAAALLEEAMSFGTAAHFASIAAEAVPYVKNLGFGQMAGLFSELAGFQEIMRGIIGVELRQAVALPHTYFINSQKRGIQPGLGVAEGWWARRKISDGQLATLTGYAGLHPDWEAASQAGAYRPVSVRALATAYQDTPFPEDEIRDILRDNGLSDPHVATMLDVLKWNSTKNVRNSYVAELVRAYEAGVVADDELDQVLSSVNYSDEAKQYVKSRVLLTRRITLATQVERQIIPEIQGGLITADEGTQALEAAGIQPWRTDLSVQLAETRATLTAAKAEAAAEHKLAIERQRVGTRAAVEQYHAGTLNEATLAVNLTALELDPLITTAIVTAESARKVGSVRFTFGQYLTPEAAQLLRSQVSAIEQQYKDQLIGIDAVRAQLGNLNIPSADINSLLANWAARLKKSPGSAILVDPLTGRPMFPNDGAPA